MRRLAYNAPDVPSRFPTVHLPVYLRRRLHPPRLYLRNEAVWRRTRPRPRVQEQALHDYVHRRRRSRYGQALLDWRSRQQRHSSVSLQLL